jgi:hypothetical protein
LRRARVTIVAVQKQQMLHMLSALIALGIQHAILSTVACPALQYFSTLFHKRHDFREKKMITHETCLDFLNNSFSETFFILRKTDGDIN